jgi:hypothetical protein
MFTGVANTNECDATEEVVAHSAWCGLDHRTCSCYVSHMHVLYPVLPHTTAVDLNVYCLA